MSMQRRQALYLIAAASGLPFVDAAAEPTQTSPAAPHPEPAMPAERVLGIGGLFFRAKDPKALAEWYRANLGIDPIPMDAEHHAWRQEAGPTAFAPFSMTTKYIGPPSQMWMINFRVRDLDKMAAQLRAGGAEVTIDPQTYPNGRFAHTHDPDQNPIELWEPAGRDAPAR